MDSQPRRLRLDLAGLLAVLADQIGQSLGSVVAGPEGAAGRPTLQVTHIKVALPAQVAHLPAGSSDGLRALGPVLASLPLSHPSAPRTASAFRLRLQPVETALTADPLSMEPTP